MAIEEEEVGRVERIRSDCGWLFTFGFGAEKVCSKGHV